MTNEDNIYSEEKGYEWPHSCFLFLDFFFDDTELLTTLREFESLVIANSGCEVVWAADMNYDMGRNNHFTRTVAAALARTIPLGSRLPKVK